MNRSEFAANVALAPAVVATKQQSMEVSGKCGNPAYPLGEQIASTIEVHGVAWAAAWYADKGVALQHFLLLAKGAGALQ